MDTEKDTKDTKKIAVGKAKNQIIINPPEKLPAKNVNELFKGARAKHAVIIEKKIELVLQSKASTAGLPEETLQQVFVRGYKSLPLNSNLTREQFAMNRVNSFIAGGQAMVEDCDLLPIMERMFRTGMKGTGGAMRPHIKREKNPYNGKTTFHVVDAKGIVKHSSNDELEAKKHLATKYNSYLGEARLDEISKEAANKYYWASKSAGDQIDAEVSKNVKKLNDKWSQRTHNKITNLLDKSQKRTTGRLRALDRLNKEEVEVTEASSAAVRMQRALDKIKADRERRERLAAPYVNSVFAKKVEDKKKDIKEAKKLKGKDPCWDNYKMIGTKSNGDPNCVGPVKEESLADQILKAAKARGINAKIAPPLEDRKKATTKLLKHRARELKRNPPPPRQMPPQKTGFGSGAIDDTKGT